jgi:two-component system chemotaxis response regulator CheB
MSEEAFLAHIVVIGGSAGALASVRVILSMLKPEFPAPICVVLHLGRHESTVARLLDSVTELPVAFAEDGEALQPGHVYVAPPDHHLRVSRNHLLLSRGPRENFSRPAIDPLFRSAAETFASGAVGVVLSGRLNDGTLGLYEIKSRGGFALVEDPQTAEFPEMPASAIANVQVDRFLPSAAIAPLLEQLVTQEAPDIDQERNPMSEDAISDPVALTCPECGGAMRVGRVGSVTQFACHIGHRMTIETLADEELTKLDEVVQVLLRRLNEFAATCRTMIEQPGVDDSERRRWRDFEAKTLAQIASLQTTFEGD